MATNTFNNAVKIAKMSADCLENNLSFTKFVNRKYESMFKDGGAKQGDTINVRIPALGYGLRHGSAASPQGYTDTPVPITLAQHGADMQFTTAELLLNMEDGEAFKQNVLNPLIAPVANYIDQTGMALNLKVNNAVGAPGTVPSNLDLFLDAGAVLRERAVPVDGTWSAVMSPRHQAGVLKGTSQYFNPQADIAAQYRDGKLGRLVSGLRFSDDQNAPTHTVGTFGTSTPVMSGTTLDGATTLVMSGWASGASTLNTGDSLTIDNVFAVNPVSKLSTGQLFPFTVVTTVSDSSGTITATITPAIQVSGVNQNVSAVPLNTAKVYVWGKNDNTYSGKSQTESLVFHPDAFSLVAVDMPKPESAVYCVRVRSPRLNIPIRLIQFYNGAMDQELYRLDVMFGWAATRPNFACRVVG